MSSNNSTLNFEVAQSKKQPPPQGQWSTGLLDCLFTCFCPCITFGQIAEIVDRGTTSCVVAGMIYHVLGSEYRELKNQGIDPSIGWQANAEEWNREGVVPPIIKPGMAR
ncbi:hypothetical protein M0R45_000930 [Rubus argutus]|uniref:PLAC8 family protein n=1 Tax=Rubus argutus TaxID=59490 RepID=A0AAW1VJL4_RUBAR